MCPAWHFGSPHADLKVTGNPFSLTSSKVSSPLSVIEVQLLFVLGFDDGDTYVGALGATKAQDDKDLFGLPRMLGLVGLE